MSDTQITGVISDTACHGKAAAAPPTGFYIATHWSLDVLYGHDVVYKVGFTGDLCRRLHDSGYKTCFQGAWRYVCTFETISAESAHDIETAVLHSCRNLREFPGARCHEPLPDEFVVSPAAKIAEIARRCAECLNITYTRREMPIYPLPAKVFRESKEPQQK